MPTEDDFLAAISANLDDDAPRLAHADWLQESDPERAEYIRLEVRLAHAVWRDWRGAAAHQADQLLDANRERWLAGRPQLRGIQWDFERGYPENVTFSTRGAYDSAWRQALVPPLRWVAFSGLRDPHWFIDSPGLARIRWLRVENCHINDDSLRLLLDSPYLEALQGLALSLSYLSGAALRLIASSPKLRGLRELNLGGCGGRLVTPDDVAALVSSPNLSDLRALDLWGWRMGNEPVRALWAARWPALRSLRLRQNEFDAEGLRGLGDGGGLPALESLDLSNNRLGDDGAMALAQASKWTRLRRLELEGNLIGERGVRALAGAAHLAGLEYLGLESNAIPDGGAEAIASLGSLVTLWLRYNLIGDAGMMALGRSAALSRLTYCCLADNPARPAVIAAVEERFEQRRPPLTDELAVAAVAAAPAAGGSAVGHTVEDGLVRALFEAPYDDLARGVYADWLEENDSPLHARLLRLPPSDPERTEILEAIGRSIVQAFPRFNIGVGEEDGLIYAGLAVRYFLLKAFQRDGPAWLRQNHISNLLVVGESKDWARIGNAPVAAQLRGLWLRYQNLRDHGVTRLAAATGLANLGALELHRTGIGGAGVLALASSANFPRLCHLELGWAQLAAEGIRALAGGPLAASLRYLDVSRTRLEDVGVAVLAQSPGLSGLVTLKIEGNLLSDRSVQALATSPYLGQLRGLDLSYNYSITDAGVLGLAHSSLASRLQWLRMGDIRAAPESYEVLKQALPPGGRLIWSEPSGSGSCKGYSC